MLVFKHALYGNAIKLLRVLFFVITFFSPATFADAYTNALTEKVLSFESDVVIKKNADVVVTETITVFSNLTQIKHGITRDFPTRYHNKFGQEVNVHFKLVDAKMDGARVPSRIQRIANGVRIYLGFPDQLLSAGVHTFVIQYQVDHELGFFNTYDELYWNVTGNGWAFAIDKAKALIHVPEGASILQYSAYTGPMYAQGQDYETTISPDKKTIAFVTTRTLAPKEGLTIAVAWPKGFVQPPSLFDELVRAMTRSWSVAISVLLTLFLFSYFFLIWWLHGKEPSSGVIFPQYQPPAGFSPAGIRYLAKFNLDRKALVAALINLAVHKKINIKESATEYVLSPQNLDSSKLTNDEYHLLDKLFKQNEHYIIPKESVDYSQTKSARDLSERGMAALENILHGPMKQYFRKNLFYFFVGVGISAVIVFLLFKHTDDLFPLFMMLFVAGCFFYVFKKAWQIWLSSSHSNFLVRFMKTIINVVFPSIVLIVFLLSTLLVGSLINTSLLLVLIVINTVFYHVVRAYTPEGQKLMDQIRGLKMYLKTTERYHLIDWKPPQKTPELYERLLPYAIALDVENDWTEQFKEVLATIDYPQEKTVFSWYSGPGQFNGFNFSNSVSRNFTSALLISSSATPPGTSSGSSGGGSSGGGGGGGGGGGW